MLRALIIGLAALTAAPVLATSTHPQALVLEVMRENKCRLETSRAEELFKARDLRPEDVSAVVNSWAEQGLAGLDGSTFEVAPALCGVHGLDAGDTQGRADVLYDFVRLNGCRMDAEVAEIKLRPAGFAQSETPGLIDALITSGRAHREDPYIIVIGDAC